MDSTLQGRERVARAGRRRLIAMIKTGFQILTGACWSEARSTHRGPSEFLLHFLPDFLPPKNVAAQRFKLFR